MTAVFLSIVMPAYNEEQRLPDALEKIVTYLERQSYTAEVLVVENGSCDRTYEIAQEFSNRNSLVRVLKTTQRGKGLAVQAGMLQAQGEYRFMCDTDLSMPIEQLDRFMPSVLGSYNIAIASREAPGAQRYNEPAYRHWVGRIYNTMIRLLAVPGLQDTQCGFKCFRAPVANALFTKQTLSGWSFDVELLFIAQRRKMKIVEVPIDWYFNPQSKISVLKDSLKMGLDLFRIRLNALKGLYDSPAPDAT